MKGDSLRAKCIIPVEMQPVPAPIWFSPPFYAKYWDQLFDGLTRDEARADLFDYLDRFYNPQRKYPTVDYLSPP